MSNFCFYLLKEVRKRLDLSVDNREIKKSRIEFYADYVGQYCLGCLSVSTTTDFKHEKNPLTSQHLLVKN